MNEYILKAFILLAFWRIAWLLIYWATGLYVGYISINNGLSFNNIDFHRKVRISASSLRFRLWGNTRKIVISDLNIALPPRSSSTRHNNAHDNISNDELSFYPASKSSRILLKIALRLLKTVDIELKYSNLSHEKFSADAKSISLLLSCHKSAEHAERYDINLSASILQACARLHSPSRCPDLLQLGSSTVSISFSIEKNTGLLSNVVTRIYVDEVELDVFHIIKNIILSPPKQSRSRLNPESNSLDAKLDSLSKLQKKISPCFKECSLNIAFFCARGIPLIPASADCSLTEYFQSASSTDTLYMSVDTVSIHMERLLPSSAGYNIHFNASQDLPIHVTFSSSLMKAGFESKPGSRCASSFCSAKNEFFSVPNVSFTFKTNAPSQLIRGFGFKNCVLEFFSSGNSPMLDVDHHQLAILAFNYTVWRKILTLRKMEAKEKEPSKPDFSLSSDNEDDFADSTRVDLQETAKKSPSDTTSPVPEKPSLLGNAIGLLKEYYPQIDVKLTVEQPRILIRVHANSDKKVSMLMISYSLMILHISTTENQDYDAECQFIHPNVTFREKLYTNTAQEVFHEEVCGLADAKLNLRIFKELKLQTKVRVNGAFVNLSKPDVLNGIHCLIDETTSRISRNTKVGLINVQCDNRILKIRETKPHPQEKPGPKNSANSGSLFFQHLPSWFVSLDFKIDDIRLQLGSASPLLPPDYISELSHSTQQRFAETESSLNLEIATVSFNIDDSTITQPRYASSMASSLPASSSSETLTGDSSPGMYWSICSKIENFKLSFFNDSKHSSIIAIPSMSHKISSVSENSTNRLIQETSIGSMNINLDRHKMFAAFGSVYLITQTILTPLKELRKRLKKNTQTLKPVVKASNTLHIMDYLTSIISIDKMDVVLALSNEFKVRLQNYDLQIEVVDGIISAHNRFLRGMVVSSTLPHHWDRVLCVDSLVMRIGDPSQDLLVAIDTHSIRFIQPHGFVVYKLFDSLSVFVKIAKHLASCFKSQEKHITVYPKVSKPVLSPGIRLNTGKLSFAIEDDPFDSELNMIYQLGLVEQRKRLEHLNIFEQQYDRKHSVEESYDRELASLQKYFERSWVRKVRIYKEQLMKEIRENQIYLFGSEPELPNLEYDRIKAYSIHAPLLSLSLMGVGLSIMKPQFPLEQISDFIHLQGQGVPKETKYNLMIPTYLNLHVEELRMHMRDYPLPLLHLPHARDASGLGTALRMRGHLIICEALTLEKEHLRELVVQLTDATNKSHLQPNSFDKLIIEKSLSTVKLYTDMNIVFNSDSPSRFVWGQSYSFGIQQIMLTVDQFSKPPLDPSPKLGFWDKLRLVIHGRISIETEGSASIEVAFKGGKDPYDLFGESNGFILRFENSVVWKINEHDDSLRFFEISAEKVSWYIPNYLANPLVCWTRESSKPTFLPGRKEFVNSCHGYYLGGTSSSADKEGSTWCEKKVVELSGGVNFTLGFLLQRFSDNGKKLTTTCRPHYEIELFNPDFTKDDHDSYNGFRSDRIHMAISLSAHTKDSHNTIHLSSGVFNQFFSWWKMFQSNMSLPIRKGKLFKELKKSQKFSEHLFTNKFLFDVRNLFIGHIFQNDERDPESDFYECIGLRAKVGEFLVDLHQRKQEVLDIHEDLSRHKKIMKMKFNLGQVLLNNIDLRTVEAKFFRDLYNQTKREPYKLPKNFLKVFDDDENWFDMRDYEECFSSFSGEVKSAKILPFLYSETFAYVRDTTKDKGSKEFLEEHTHSCILNNTDYQSSEIELYKRRIDELKTSCSQNLNDSTHAISERINVLEKLIKDCKTNRDSCTRQNSVVAFDSDEKESFHNRFLLISMFLKWNEPVRNQFMKYVHFVNLGSIHKKFLSFEFMSFLEGIISKQDNLNGESSLSSTLSESVSRNWALSGTHNKIQTSEERFNDFDRIIRSVEGIEKIIEDYKIEIISPQIQLHTEELKNSVVMITAPSLESKIVSIVTEKDVQYQSNPNILEKRYGVILNNASVMVIDEADVQKKNFAFEMAPYGTKTRWPPFLGIETCKSHEFASPENVLVEKMSLMLTFNQFIASSANIEQMDTPSDSDSSGSNMDPGENSADKLRVDVPRIAINCTSKQYFTLYATILSLILYVEPMAAELREKVRKLNFSIDFQDFHALRERLVSLYEYLGIIKQLLKNYNFRENGYLDNEDLNDYLLLRNKQAALETDIVLMQQTLFSGDIVTDSLSRVIQDWRIAADTIVLHMLNDDRSHILDLSIDHGVYKRTVKDDGSNNNRIEIMSIDGRTRLPNAYFKTFLEPMRAPQTENLIKIDWSMNRSIGGIKIIDNFDICSLPLNVRIDEETGRSLMEFIFRQTEADDFNESPILKIADRVQSDSTAKEEGQSSNPNENQDSDQANSEVISSRGSETKSSFKESSLATSSKMDLDQDVNSMVQRSKKYLSIAKLTSRSFEVMISLRMENGIKRWLNVTNFLLVLPQWEIEKQILSLFEVVNHFKSVVIKALVGHSGSLLKNKLNTRSKNVRRYTKILENSQPKTSSVPE
ncbi:hypothetical protein JCM33374_g3010 [Metschnikowia sp. JCM 33374]|nr:hypothetical protein JCM33374_g3010 [Metschnikowia sp. JCM 33374]